MTDLVSCNSLDYNISQVEMKVAKTYSLNPLICLVIGLNQPLKDIWHEELTEVELNVTPRKVELSLCNTERK